MTMDEVFSLIALNRANFAYWNKDADKSQIQALAATWYDLFADLPADVVLAAYKLALRHAEFPIVPANIFAELEKVRKANRTSIEILWRELMEAADYCYKKSCYYEFYMPSMIYKNMTQAEEAHYMAEYKFKNMCDENKEFIGNISRLIELGRMDNGERERFFFPRYRKFIEEYQQREETMQYLPQGMKMIGGA